VDLVPRVTLVCVDEPAKRSGGVVVESVFELVEKLKTEAKVIA
jgi:electron transfer flavoprotein beta subunit